YVLEWVVFPRSQPASAQERDAWERAARGGADPKGLGRPLLVGPITRDGAAPPHLRGHRHRRRRPGAVRLRALGARQLAPPGRLAARREPARSAAGAPLGGRGGTGHGERVAAPTGGRLRAGTPGPDRRPRRPGDRRSLPLRGASVPL